MAMKTSESMNKKPTSSLDPGSNYSFTHFQNNTFQTSKFKVFADGNFKFDKNGRKFSKRIENTVGKGEIALF